MLNVMDMGREWLRLNKSHSRDWERLRVDGITMDDDTRHSEYNRLKTLYAPLDDLGRRLIEVLSDKVLVIDNVAVYQHVNDGAVHGWIMSREIYKYPES